MLIPTYNEIENVEPLSEAIIEEFKKLPQYELEIVFIDNDSNDGTRDKLREMCRKNKIIKAIIQPQKNKMSNILFIIYKNFLFR